MAKMKICILLVFFLPLLVCGQVKNNAFNGARQQVGGNNKSVFNQNRVNNFNDYRQKLNAEYIRMTREKWRDFNPYEGLKQPDDDVKPVAPIQMSDDDAFRNKQDRIIKIDGVVKPLRNNGRPQPIAPVQETPENNPQYLAFNYLGTSLQVRKPQNGRFNLSGVSGNAIADAWEQLCDPRFNNMLIDCIKLRSNLKLCDWAYLMMLWVTAIVERIQTKLLCLWLFFTANLDIKCVWDNLKVVWKCYMLASMIFIKLLIFYWKVKSIIRCLIRQIKYRSMQPNIQKSSPCHFGFLIILKFPILLHLSVH